MSESVIDKIFQPLYTSDKRYFFLTGGRGSTKTFNEHEFVAKLTYEKGHGILFTRYTMASAEKSIIPEFKQTIKRLGMTHDFHVTKTTATNLKTGTFIFFSGIKTSSGDQTANLKSLPNITTWVIEEGEDFTDELAFDTIDDSLRKKGIQNRVIWIMNPATREHFIFDRWVKKWEVPIEIDGFQIMISDHPEVESIHSTYLVATKYLSHSFLKKAWKWRTRAKTGFCPIEQRELSEDEKQSAINWYKSNYLGGWRDFAEGVIYEDWRIGEFPDNLPYIYGMDLGSKDPDAIVKVAIDWGNMTAYIDEIHYKNNSGRSYLMEIIHNKIGTEDFIVSDSNERRLIRDLQDGVYSTNGEWLKGVNIRAIQKRRSGGLGFVKYKIGLTKSFTLVFTKESKNCIEAVRNYVWHDKRANVPNHGFSHLPNAWEYAIVELND